MLCQNYRNYEMTTQWLYSELFAFAELFVYMAALKANIDLCSFVVDDGKILNHYFKPPLFAHEMLEIKERGLCGGLLKLYHY